LEVVFTIERSFSSFSFGFYFSCIRASKCNALTIILKCLMAVQRFEVFEDFDLARMHSISLK